MSGFKGIYECDDGYIGKSRPQEFSIDEFDIEDDMDEEELCILFDDMMQNHFEQNIFPFAKNQNEFVEWAMSVIDNREDND